MRADVSAAVLASTLRLGAASMGVPLGDEQVDALMRYLAMIQKWNRVYNLTALRDPESILTHHLLDSMAVLPSLRTRGAETRRVLDVGSGAGLPGVVLGLLNPEWAVTCIDAVGKKASFIQQVATELRLVNVRALHGRVESVSLEPQDLVISRAFSSLSDFCGLTVAALAPFGQWAAMKGKHPRHEIDALPASYSVFHVEQLMVPSLDAERCLVWIKRTSCIN